MRTLRNIFTKRSPGPEESPPRGPSHIAGQAPTIGVLVPNMVNSVFGECIEGMEEAARTSGYSLLVTFTNYDVDREEGAINSLIDRDVEGLVLTVADANASTALALLDRKRYPYVLIYNQVSHLPRSTISVDNTKASQDLVEVLIQHGHRNIGMVVGSLRASDRSVRRLEGYRTALRAHGLPTGPIVEIPFNDIDEDQLLWRLKETMQEGSPPSAFFCSNDMLALIVIRGLRKLGFAIPADVSVVGFDGIAFGQLLDPPLAGIVQPNRTLGATAARHLIERISLKTTPSAILLAHQIRQGGTLGRWASG